MFVSFAFLLVPSPQTAPLPADGPLPDNPLSRVEAALRRAGYVLRFKGSPLGEGTLLPRGTALVRLGTPFAVDRELPQAAWPIAGPSAGPKRGVVLLPSLGRTARALDDGVFDGMAASPEGARP